jgi:hypothetical protein
MEITMYAYGREIITDPGVTGYGLPIGLKILPTSAHSTICVDDRDQGGCVGREHIWVTQPGMDFVDAEATPYRGLVHRRQIVFLKSGLGAPDYWLIRDSVTGDGDHRYDLNYHLSARADPKIVDGSVCTTYAGGGNALIRLLDQSVKPEIVDSSIALVLSLVPSKTCRFTRQGATPARFDTPTLPYKGAKVPAVKTEYVSPDPECANADAVCIRVATRAGHDTIVISGTPGTALSFGKGTVRTDAVITVIRTDRKGRITYAYTNGGSATYEGKPVTAASQQLTRRTLP